MLPLRPGLVGGLFATVAMTMVMLALGDDGAVETTTPDRPFRVAMTPASQP